MKAREYHSISCKKSKNNDLPAIYLQNLVLHYHRLIIVLEFERATFRLLFTHKMHFNSSKHNNLSQSTFNMCLNRQIITETGKSVYTDTFEWNTRTTWMVDMSYGRLCTNISHSFISCFSHYIANNSTSIDEVVLEEFRIHLWFCVCIYGP